VDVDLQYFNGNPINVKLASKMIFEIAETEPGVKGNTAGNVTKNAKIETGHEIKVPPFIEKGEKVVINTDTGEYVERAK
jgi:elongation factor P